MPVILVFSEGSGSSGKGEMLAEKEESRGERVEGELWNT